MQEGACWPKPVASCQWIPGEGFQSEVCQAWDSYDYFPPSANVILKSSIQMSYTQHFYQVFEESFQLFLSLSYVFCVYHTVIFIFISFSIHFDLFEGRIHNGYVPLGLIIAEFKFF